MPRGQCDRAGLKLKKKIIQNMCSRDLTIVMPPIFKIAPVFLSRKSLAILLIVINFFSRTVSGVDRNTTIALDTWLTDTESEYDEIIASCLDKCANEDEYYGSVRTVGCASYKDLCSEGCRQWKQATFSTCKQTCHNDTWGSLSPCDLACISGCKEAVSGIKSHLGQLWEFQVPLMLTNSTENGTFLTFSWPIEGNKYPTERLLLQWSYEETPSRWRYSSSFHWINNYTCVIENLQPYTKYKFRIAMIITKDPFDFVFTAESKIIYSPPMGPPSSAPEITKVLTLDHEKIAVFWKQGRFTNAPLEGYKIKAKALDATEESTRIEIMAEASDNYIILHKLKPQQRYDIEVSMVNVFGQGPHAVVVATTANLAEEDLNREFIVVGHLKVTLLKTSNDGSSTKELYKSDRMIVGFDVLIAQQILFVCDDGGNVYRINMYNEAERDAIISPKSVTSFKPSKLTVDWLNSYLYIVGEVNNKESPKSWLIARTGYSGNGLKLVVVKLKEEPLEIYADPLNGYLFWLTSESGIHRLDLADESWKLIYKKQGLTSFTVNLKTFFIIAFLKEQRRFVQISYDGRFSFADGGDISPGEVVDEVVHNSKLYWTDGNHLYSNQSVTVLFDNCKLLKVFYGSSQLLPPPTNAPVEIQALLTAEMAKISWKPPPKLYFQGAAYWTAWQYDLEVKEVEVILNIRHIKSEIFNVDNLKPSTEYSFRVRATNRRDVEGPWSEWFRSKTWKLDEERYLLWASENGLLRTNEVGSDKETLLNGSISGLTWANGTFFLAKDDIVGHWDMSNFTFGNITAENIGYDWKGQKLYVAGKNGEPLVRTTSDATERELLPILGVKHMELDSQNGYIYYSTGLRIEACTLSGSGCMTYYRTSLLSDEDLIGPTLDHENRRVLWVTLSDHDSFLFSAAMAPESKEENGLTMTPLEGFSVAQWFSYLSEQLVWPAGNASLVLADGNGENQAVFSLDGKVNDVLLVEREENRHQALYNTIPEQVDTSSIRVTGFWDNFTITWDPVATGGGYNASYLVKIGEDIFLESHEPDVQYPRLGLPAYSRLKVWITSISPWSTGPTVEAEIFSPTAAPSEPERLRVFTNRVHNPLQGGQNISAVVRWNPPKEPNGPIVMYTITCKSGPDFVVSQNSTGLEAVFWGVQENSTYLFEAQAFTSGAGGTLSEPVTITIVSEYQSIPRVLSTSDGIIGLLDMDLNTTEVLAETHGIAKFVSAFREENRIFWLNEAGLLLSRYKDDDSVLSALGREVDALAVDWICRIIYWSEPDHGGGSTVHSLDINRFEGELLQGKQLISNPKRIKDLVMLPFSQTLLWLDTDGGVNGWNFRELTELNPLLDTNVTFIRMYQGSFEENLESVILVDEKDSMCVFGLHTNTCQAFKVGIDSPNFHLAWDNGFVYALKNNSIRAYNRRKKSIAYMVKTDGITEITALAYQPYPERRCLLPDYDQEPLIDLNSIVPQLMNSTEQSLELRFPRIASSPGCGFKVPGLKYTLFIREAGKENATVRLIRCFEPQANVTDLKPFTKYVLQLQVSNYYAEKLGIENVLGPVVNLSTAPGTPSAPRNVTVSAVSPRDGLVEWMHPEVLNNDRVWYEIHWQTENPTNGLIHRQVKAITEGNDKWNVFLLSSLRPDQFYLVWIKVFSTDLAFNISLTYSFRTFPEPQGLVFVEATAYSLRLSWKLAPYVTSAFLLYSPLDVADPISVNITGESYMRLIESLEPKTKYSFHLKLFYSHSVYSYVWPPDNRFVFETLGDSPDAPGQPVIEHIKGEVFKLFWDPAKSNGASIEEYSLEALQASKVKRVRRSSDEQRVSNKTLARLAQLPWAEEIEPVQDEWIPYWNGTETSCVITELHTMRLLMFRVRARNSYGWGPYSADSEMIAEPFVSPRKRDTLVLAIIAPITIVATCVSMAVLFRYVHGRRKHAKKLLQQSRPSIWGLDVATLQQVARSRNFSQTSSMLYTGKPLTDGDIALLPQISRNQINMQKFLGSGAFGEVYEGVVTYSCDGSQDRVAIKTLRKGASEQEKTELLQEAHLMSHFKHDNIVRLIGVCFDLDSICIIMELMEGGDLQTYLRQARPTLTKLGTLSLLDLVGFCLDVCTGCRYLEDLHFLHRDLACRNCLVSSVDPEFRVVKIGDFGLARDIYKSDYYRKEGEGLLPVRWMAPECLVDGVFTPQSDIWSFGILLWEILSLGQQPYPAQSNLEVLNFVKEGGRLQQPLECPDKLYKLMIQCWSHEPDDRPTFQQCLNELLSVKLEALNVKHTKDCQGGVLNMSYSDSDEESISKASKSSRADSPSCLDNNFIKLVEANQRNEIADTSRELDTFKIPTENDTEAGGTQPKRKSVHYVNEGLSRF